MKEIGESGDNRDVFLSHHSSKADFVAHFQNILREMG